MRRGLEKRSVSRTMAQPIQYYPPLRLVDRLVALVAWAMAIALFLTIGWRALQPTDPQGAVSMLTCPHPWLMVVQMGMLGVVVAALATLLVGRKLADAGVFTTCLGLAVANLRADTVESILISVVDRGNSARANLAASFLFEALIGFVFVVLAMVTSGFVLRWCFSRGEAGRLSVLSTMAVGDMPLISDVLRCDAAPRQRSALGAGLGQSLFTTVAAFGLIGVLSTGTPARAITHGQVYFSIAAAFWIAGDVAHRKWPVRTPFWTCLAVPVVAVAAYVWVMLVDSDKAAALPPSIPHSVYLRALPLEYIILGTLGALLAFWDPLRLRHSAAPLAAK